jgi:hypothetical protein
MKKEITKSDRVFLHLKCVWKDHYWVWHWQGIKREVAQYFEDRDPSAPSFRSLNLK